MEEGVTFEAKSSFDWKHGQPHAIAKTIVAFANSQGGTIHLKNVQCDQARLDSARIADFVNKSVAPPITGITANFNEEGECVISVDESADAPHIFVKNSTYRDSEEADRTAWHAGQVYARHSSKTEPATSDDLTRIIQRRVAEWLSKLGSAIESLSLDVREGGSALPVSFSKGPGALKIGISDPNKDYPYLAKTLGKKIGKSQNWTQVALQKLGCKDSPIYSIAIFGGSGKIALRKYNHRALECIKDKLSEDPDFDPFHC